MTPELEIIKLAHELDGLFKRRRKASDKVALLSVEIATTMKRLNELSVTAQVEEKKS